MLDVGREDNEKGIVNQLMNAPYPDGTKQLLEAQREILNPDLMAALDQLITELEQAGNTDVADHMRQVKNQAETISQGVLTP